MPPRLDGEAGEEGGDRAFSDTRRHTHHSALRPQVGVWRTQSVLCRLQMSAVTPQLQTPPPIIRTTLSPMNPLSFFSSEARDQAFQARIKLAHISAFSVFSTPLKKQVCMKKGVFFSSSNKTTAHKGGNCAQQFASAPSRTYCTSDYLKQISCNFDSREKDEAIISAKICFLARKRTAAF